MKTEHEKLLLQMAYLYAESEGADLHEELKYTKNHSVLTPGLEKKMRKELFRTKYKVHMRVGSLVAACLALALLLPLILWQPHRGMFAPSPQAQADYFAPAGIAPTADDAAFRQNWIEAEEEMHDGLDMRVNFEMDEEDAAPQAAGGLIGPFGALDDDIAVEEITEGYGAHILDSIIGFFSEEESVNPPLDLPSPWSGPDRNTMIPIDFPLPDGFYTVDTTHYQDQSIFYITNEDSRISLIVRYTQNPPEIYEGFRAMELGGHTVYYYTHGNEPYSFTVITFVITLDRDYSILYILVSPSLESSIILSQAILGG